MNGSVMKYGAVVLAMTWLSGCNTLGSSQNDAGLMDGEGVIVEDRGVVSDGLADGGINGSDIIDGAEAQVIAGEGTLTESQLDDPNHLLSQRVVYFEYDSSAVRDQDYAVLQAHASYLADNPTAKVRIEGHTDQRGSREYNLALGERRALAIREILMIQGAMASQFQVTSFGEERPQQEGEGEAVWQANRRVELVYTGR